MADRKLPITRADHRHQRPTEAHRRVAPFGFRPLAQVPAGGGARTVASGVSAPTLDDLSDS